MATKLQRINRIVDDMTHAASAIFGGDIFKHSGAGNKADIDVIFHLDAMGTFNFLAYIRDMHVHPDRQDAFSFGFIQFLETLGEAASHIEDHLSTPKPKG